MVSNLFEPGLLGRMTLKNRFVRSATWEGMAHEDSSCSRQLADLTADLARGEIGLIISSHTFVSSEGQAGPRQLAVYDDRFIPGLDEMVTAAHDGGSKIVLQLAHAGIQALTSLTQLEALGPTALTSGKRTLGRTMTQEEIERTIHSFVAAAKRAEAAGFDGVQIHAAHGYLLSESLSPYFNQRTDEFGESVENRARIVLKILEGIKAACGNGYPVLIKMNSEDFIEGGLSLDEMLQIVEMLEEAGIDGIEMSGGTTDAASQFKPVRRGKLPSEKQEVYYRESAKRYKESIGVPLILVGGIRSYTVAEKLAKESIADYTSLSRPFNRGRSKSSAPTTKAIRPLLAERTSPVKMASGSGVTLMTSSYPRKNKPIHRMRSLPSTVSSAMETMCGTTSCRTTGEPTLRGLEIAAQMGPGIGAEVDRLRLALPSSRRRRTPFT